MLWKCEKYFSHSIYNTKITFFFKLSNIFLFFINYSNTSSTSLVRELKIKTSTDYINLGKSKKLPKNLPYKPHKFYLNTGWVNWGEFLGTGSIANKNIIFVTYEEFKLFIKKTNYLIYNNYRRDFHNLKKIENKIPMIPSITYKNKGWVSWAHLIKEVNEIT